MVLMVVCAPVMLYVAISLPNRSNSCKVVCAGIAPFIESVQCPIAGLGEMVAIIFLAACVGLIEAKAMKEIHSQQTGRLSADVNSKQSANSAVNIVIGISMRHPGLEEIIEEVQFDLNHFSFSRHGDY